MGVYCFNSTAARFRCIISFVWGQRNSEPKNLVYYPSLRRVSESHLKIQFSHIATPTANFNEEKSRNLGLCSQMWSNFSLSLQKKGTPVC